MSRVRHALAEALRLDPDVDADDPFAETADVDAAAKLLHTTPRAIYVRHHRGKMPRPVQGARRLVWRKADLLRLVK